MTRVEAAALSKAYERRFALREVTCAFLAGRVTALIGHNGAGKSTLLHLLALRTRPTSGEVRIDGQLAESDAEFRAALGVVSHASFLYSALTARENLTLVAQLYRRPATDLDALLARVGLERAADRLVREFSRGMVQRLAIARLLLQEAQLWLLDEPATGLDERGCRWLEGEILAARAAGRIVVVSSHHRDLLHATATDALVLVRGRVVHAAPTDPQSLDTLFNEHL